MVLTSRKLRLSHYILGQTLALPHPTSLENSRFATVDEEN